MKISGYPRIIVACALLAAAGCSKKEDTPPPVVSKPAATGTYTDASGSTFALADLRAVVGSATLATGAAGQRVTFYGTLADGRVVLAGYSVAQTVMPTTAGALPMAPATDAYFIRVALPSDTTPAFGSLGVSYGTLTYEAPAMLSGQFSGPLRPATLPLPPNAPKASVVFAHVPIQP